MGEVPPTGHARALSSSSVGSRRVSSDGSLTDSAQLQKQLYAAFSGLMALEGERRRLIDASLGVLAHCSDGGRESPPDASWPVTPALSSPSCHGRAGRGLTPPSGDSEEIPSLPGAGEAAVNNQGSDKPEWLLADGRVVTAALEGENLALRRAVERARGEINDLVQRRSAAEVRAKRLAEENKAAAEALRLAADRNTGASSQRAPCIDGETLETPSVAPAEASLPVTPTSCVDGLPAGVTPEPDQVSISSGPTGRSFAAADSLRRLVLTEDAGPLKPVASTPAQETRPAAASALLAALAMPAAGSTKPQQDKGAMHTPAPAPTHRSDDAAKAAAQAKLLEFSEDIERRMEEILARKGKLQVALGTAQGS